MRQVHLHSRAGRRPREIRVRGLTAPGILNGFSQEEAEKSEATRLRSEAGT